MRFNWRSHLVVTALATLSLLPFTGCSSQQQQASDEVQASEEDGGQGQEGAEESSQQADAQGGGDEASQEGNATETAEGGESENVVSNNAMAQNNAAAGEGDLQEIINEMGSNNTGASGNAMAAAPTEEIPVDQAAAAPTNASAPATNAAAPMEAAAPAEAPSGAMAQGLPELGSKMPYVVESGDTLGKIATKIYGDQTRWRDLSSLTGLTNPNQIYPGDVVYFSMDESSAQFAATYAGIRRGKETVREGDTLASISSRVYGTSKGWRHIWRQNDNIDNPDQLTVGMAIYYVERDFVKTTSNNLKNPDVSTQTKLFSKTKTTYNHSMKPVFSAAQPATT